MNNVGIIFMKIGVHAQEDLSAIIHRKKKEILDTGIAFWGYGGNTCHPITMVQTFANNLRASGKTLKLVMQTINSHHHASPERAKEYSTDGINWNLINDKINVLGSRYALVLNSLEEVNAEIDLSSYEVGVGNSMGTSAIDYIQGRVDKGCLSISSQRSDFAVAPKIIPVSLIADICPPYAVLLK